MLETFDHSILALSQAPCQDIARAFLAPLQKLFILSFMCVGMRARVRACVPSYLSTWAAIRAIFGIVVSVNSDEKGVIA